MNVIYKMQNGNFIDLSKICLVGEVKNDINSSRYCFSVTFQLIERDVPIFLAEIDAEYAYKTLDFYSLEAIEYEKNKLNEYRDDLINAWYKFNEETNNQG